jgi:hypothetical protein
MLLAQPGVLPYTQLALPVHASASSYCVASRLGRGTVPSPRSQHHLLRQLSRAALLPHELTWMTDCLRQADSGLLGTVVALVWDITGPATVRTL